LIIATSFKTLSSNVINVGSKDLIFVPSPRQPSTFKPQLYILLLLNKTTECSKPAEKSMIFPGILIFIGKFLEIVVPSPN
jgi:hypothetical protein